MIAPARPCLARLAVMPLALMAIGIAHSARAGDLDRFMALEENDSLYFNSDKHYTQGVRFSDLRPEVKDAAWQEPFNALNGIASVFDPVNASGRHYAIFAGQSIFTPKNTALNPPDPGDRPYAGWLYGGVGLLQRTQQATASDAHRAMLENLELELGVVGPAAFGEKVQNDFHQLIGDATAQGWEHQLRNEPGLMVSYERLWRFMVVGDADCGVDFVPELGATVGNVMTYGSVGGLIRIGSKLGTDFGPAHIRPALSGTDYFDASAIGRDWGYYFFVGTQGRVVGQNVFLDGNTFRESRSVDKRYLVVDVEAGFAVYWSTAIRFDFSVAERSPEFEHQDGPDPLGSASVAFSW
jgi:lipid A 3-O-deacylase